MTNHRMGCNCGNCCKNKRGPKGATGNTGATGSTGQAGSEIIVENIAALAALNTSNLPNGTRALVLSVDQEFELNVLGTDPVDGITTVAASNGGTWNRIYSHVPRWSNQRNWFVDPLNGNDENDGTTALTALRTLMEWDRRIKVMRLSPTPDIFYNIQLLNDVPLTDTFRPSAWISEDYSGDNVYSVVLRGQRRIISSGVSGVGSAITNPGANQQAQFDGGPGFLPAANIGRMVQMANGALAWITKDLGGTIAQVSEWVTVNTDNLPSPIVTLVAAPPAGTAYDIIAQTQFNAPFISLGTPILRLRFIDLHFTPTGLAEDLTIRSVSSAWITSRVQRKPVYQGGFGPFHACGFDFDTLTQLNVLDSSVIRWQACGIRNAFVVSTRSGFAVFENSHIQGGFIRGSRLVATQIFGSANGPGGPGGAIGSAGPRGLGIFDAPVQVGQPAALFLNHAAYLLGFGPIYGANNNGFGVAVREGSQLFLVNTINPTITGTLGDLELEASPTAMPPLENFAGGPLPALSPLTTWAQWQAAPFSRSVMNYATGSVISGRVIAP